MRRKARIASMGAAGVIASSIMLGTFAAPVVAETLTVVGHRVHQTTMTGDTGGDFAAEWAAQNGAQVEWLTFDVAGIHDRLYREASLSSTAVNVGFAANLYFTPEFDRMFTPLNDFQAANPIEAFEELPVGMLDAMTIDGKLYGIPFRHATAALHVNTAILAELGLDVPTTFEELLDVARASTHTRADGAKVFGLVLDERAPTHITDIARAQSNGDFLTPSFELKANSAEMIAAVQTVKDLFDEGVLPDNFLNFQTEDGITLMQQGRGVMAISPFGRNVNFNNPNESLFAGDIISIPVPASETLTEFDAAPVRTEFWAMFIPQNASNPELAWDFIRNASSPENTIRGALNGNGPVRPSAYDDPRMAELIAYAAAEQSVLAVARPPLPGWRNSARVIDIFKEEMDLLLLGMKTAEAAMNSVQERATPLLPE